MPRIKLTLEYDGTEYVGWQVQPNGPSVQGCLEDALLRLLKEPVRVVGAGRTDAGVHALGQVACFDTAQALPMQAYWMGLSGLLPESISVVDAEEVDARFDPRGHAVGKLYRYLLSHGRRFAPLRRRTHWQLFAPLDVKAMRSASSSLLGRHDFSAFRASGCEARHPIREVKRLELVEGEDHELRLFVEGTAFLRHMVRNMVGSLVEVGRGRQGLAWVREVLESRDRTRAGPTAPAHGLTLMQVFFGGRNHRSAEADEDE